jgi:hypothetical protein
VIPAPAELPHRRRTAASTRFAIAAAKARTGEAAGTVARVTHQVHGAIGFTREHDLRLVTPSGRRAALKVVHPDLAADPGFRERFRREVQMAATAPPWFTAPVLDADPDGANPWLATAYVEGPSLQTHVSENGRRGALRRPRADLAGAAGAGGLLPGLRHRCRPRRDGRGAAELRGDTVAGDPSLVVLAYGEAVRFDGVVRVSRETGLRCENPQTGHGFTVARASYDVF